MKNKIICIVVISILITSFFGVANSTKINKNKESFCSCEINSDYEFSVSDLCGYIPIENFAEDLTQNPLIASSNLPESFDWRDEVTGSYPSIKDQTLIYVPYTHVPYLSCGACWAFASCGVFEWVIKIRDGDKVDLSEQYLISCNKDKLPSGDPWGCEGGYVAFDYFKDKTGKCNNDAGAVLESDFPYEVHYNWGIPMVPDDVECKKISNHPYEIEGWSYVYPRTNGVPAVEILQQAIYQYGPVYSGVKAGNDNDNHFLDYTSGVYSYEADGPVNHAVVIIGWEGEPDDENGYWIVKNSWGNWWWGEDGYMKIKYGCSSIGHHAAYVNYKDPKSDLRCSGSLSWSDVEPGNKVTGSFSVKNDGDEHSFLNWKVQSHPNWGSWTITPNSVEGENSLCKGEQMTVKVSVSAPEIKDNSYSGSIKIVNQDDNYDFEEISVSLATPKYKNVKLPFLQLFRINFMFRNFFTKLI